MADMTLPIPLSWRPHFMAANRSCRLFLSECFSPVLPASTKIFNSCAGRNDSNFHNRHSLVRRSLISARLQNYLDRAGRPKNKSYLIWLKPHPLVFNPTALRPLVGLWLEWSPEDKAPRPSLGHQPFITKASVPCRENFCFFLIKSRDQGASPQFCPLNHLNLLIKSLLIGFSSILLIVCRCFQYWIAIIVLHHRYHLHQLLSFC